MGSNARQQTFSAISISLFLSRCVRCVRVNMCVHAHFAHHSWYILRVSCHMNAYAHSYSSVRPFVHLTIPQMKHTHTPPCPLHVLHPFMLSDFSSLFAIDPVAIFIFFFNVSYGMEIVLLAKQLAGLVR